jgi:hypothetical protein
MNDMPDFDDPAFYGRVRAWAAERADSDRAPDRLVSTVMVAVEATPRRRRAWLAPDSWRPLSAYAALTLVVAFGVTLGVLLAGRIDSIGPKPTSSPSATPSASPSVSPTPPRSQGPVASPVALAQLGDIAIAATALEWDGASVWAVDRSNTLLELEPASGAVKRSVALPRAAVDLLVTTDSIWAASPDGPLMRVGRTDLAITEIAGAAGGALAEGNGVVWLGGLDTVVGIAVGDNAVGPRAGVPGRAADLGVAVVGSGTWVATRTEILQLDASSLALIGRVTGDATRLVSAGGFVWATRGSELAQINPSTALAERFIPGTPGGLAIAASEGRIWVAGAAGTGGATVAGVETATGTLAYRGSAGTLAIGLTVTSSEVWVASDEEGVIHRFALP